MLLAGRSNRVLPQQTQQWLGGDVCASCCAARSRPLLHRCCIRAVTNAPPPAARCHVRLQSGVSVEGELLPRFVELLLQGPPLSSTSSAGGGGAAQQQLVQWRLQRQARLLYVQEQLAELPHALETLRCA